MNAAQRLRSLASTVRERIYDLKDNAKGQAIILNGYQLDTIYDALLFKARALEKAALKHAVRKLFPEDKELRK